MRLTPREMYVKLLTLIPSDGRLVIVDTSECSVHFPRIYVHEKEGQTWAAAADFPTHEVRSEVEIEELDDGVWRYGNDTYYITVCDLGVGAEHALLYYYPTTEELEEEVEEEEEEGIPHYVLHAHDFPEEFTREAYRRGFIGYEETLRRLARIRRKRGGGTG